MARTSRYVAYCNARVVYVRKPECWLPVGPWQCVVLHRLLLRSRVLSLFPFRQGLIHSRHNSYSGLRVGYPSPTRYLVSRRMRTNLAHVSPICIYMNRRGLRDWNKFGRLSELGNLYGHTSNRRAYPYRCVCIRMHMYVKGTGYSRTQPRRAIKLYYAAICLTAKKRIENKLYSRR